MKRLQLIVLTSLIFLLATCASISKQECLVGEWEQLGYRDGSQGKASSRLGAHMEECGKHGMAVDRTLYQKGYQEGLKVYCTYERGVEIGRAGRYFTEVCPVALAAEFRRGYQFGQQIKKLEDQITTLETEVQKLEEQLIAEAVAYERRKISGEISTKRALIQTLRSQITILESQNLRGRS